MQAEDLRLMGMRGKNVLLMAQHAAWGLRSHWFPCSSSPRGQCSVWPIAGCTAGGLHHCWGAWNVGNLNHWKSCKQICSTFVPEGDISFMNPNSKHIYLFFLEGYSISVFQVFVIQISLKTKAVNASAEKTWCMRYTWGKVSHTRDFFE